jgi:hypothetical protein
MPMPKAIVATTIRPSSRRNRDWCAARVPESRPAWYGTASMPLRDRNSAVASTDLRDRQYTMPASPACSSRRKLSSCFLGSAFGTIRYWMLGRSKLATKCRASGIFSRWVISLCVASVAVAVRAILGTSGQRSPSSERER